MNALHARTLLLMLVVLLSGIEAGAGTSQTVVSLRDGKWCLNGEALYPGAPAEGLLMNVRMVNAIFEDLKRPDFDAEANTDEFLAKIPEYKAHGVRAFTLCLQGGMPGYEGAVNSAFAADGSLRPSYLARAGRVIEACDREGIAVILGCFYQRQCRILKDENAIRAGVVNVAQWIKRQGYTNVMLEIANEYPHAGFKARPLLRNPEGEAELIRLAKATAPGLLVSASGFGDAKLDDAVARASDFLLIHLNGVKPGKIAAGLPALRKYGKPIVCNEDADVGEAGMRSAQVCVEKGVSWGYMNEKVNQHWPFTFGGAADDPVVYAKLKLLTTANKQQSTNNKPQTTNSKRETSGDLNYFPPPDAAGGWRTLKRDDEIRRVAGMHPANLDQAFESAKKSTKNGGLLVVRHGWLVYERYFGKGHHEATPNLASCGKSFTSVAMGILMHEHPELFPDGLDQKIWTPQYLPPMAFPPTDPAKTGIKLGQLLSFTAGIRGNNPCLVNGKETTIAPAGPDGWPATVDEIALGLRDAGKLSTKTLWCPPGGGYSYATSSIHIVSIVLRQLTGMELEEYVRRHIAEPLGWGRWGWGYRAYVRETMHTPGGGGIAVRPTDMLRFGYLMLHDGRWGERQIVPADYVRLCRNKSPYNPHTAYSLQFNVNADGEIAGAPRDAFWKMGSGGHVLYVVPSLDLVVWKLGGRDSQYEERDTGVKIPAEVKNEMAKGAAMRKDWKPQLSDMAAARAVLEQVAQAAK